VREKGNEDRERKREIEREKERERKRESDKEILSASKTICLSALQFNQHEIESARTLTANTKEI
jgi:hypothetical protein